jgi:hypothetical protein
MKKLTETEWLAIVNEAANVHYTYPHLRLGQCIFNILYEKYPLVADSIRGTEYDPFYKEITIKFASKIENHIVEK